MGIFNDVMCDYLSHKEVFADFVNGALFQGEREVCSKRLQFRDKEYYARKGGKEAVIPYRRRDILMADDYGISYVVLGVELQEKVHFGMTVRSLEYDARQYGRQLEELQVENKGKGVLETPEEFLSGIPEGTKLMPVVTIVFYRDKKPYNGCTELHDMLEWNKDNIKYKPFVANYQMNLVLLDKLEEECFQTGLREVIGCMKRSEDKEEFFNYCIENGKRFQNMDDLTFRTLCGVIGEKKLIRYGLIKEQKEEIDMCKALEDMRTDARLEGIEIGIEQGIEQINKLVTLLVRDNRIEDLARSAADSGYRRELFAEYGV